MAIMIRGLIKVRNEYNMMTIAKTSVMIEESKEVFLFPKKF